ncbi:MAG TPA: ParB/RepB/Spo0J family partition protein [Pseudogracilibacillus sp.]|nr:ParB/RepB/Spo0J family partition protein [Pseudogracilibacillus sp.]
MARGLGKGINALFPDVDMDEAKIHKIPIKECRPNPYQPRKTFDADAIEELKTSILEYGIIQPLILRKSIKGYEIVAGERRFRAAKEANLTEVPAVIQDLTDQKMMEIALLENLQREDLSIIEEALAYKNLLEELNLTQEELSDKLGKSRSHIANTVRLLTLPEEVITHINNGDLSMGHGRAILGLKNKAHIKVVVDKTLEEKLNVRQIEKLILKLNENKVKTKKVTPKKDIFIAKQEEELRSVLGTAVKIQKNKNKGKIEIDFYDDDDLERLLTHLKR